jgi:hypothetical protein
MMLRAKPLIIWCLGGRAIALSVSRRTFAIGTAAAPFAAYADVPAQTYDGLYVVEGSKSRRRVVTRDGAVVVEAEERGQWRALESSADSDGLRVAGKSGVFESARNSAVLDCMVQVTFPADSIRWSDGERWVRKRVLYPKT